MTAASTDLLLPPDARLLHIGPQKTGSTALQEAIQARRSRLRELGVTAVGTDRPERSALWAALMHPDSTEDRYREDFDRWRAMVAEIDQAEGRVVISNESIGKAAADGARRMVEAFGGPRVHVLAVARRLDRLLPSQWQQRVKMNATTLSYEQWLAVVLDHNPDDPAWQNIWVPHDLGALVTRWTDAAAADRFTLLVADEADRSLLSSTVESMLGLPEGLLRPRDEHRSNVSMGYGRLELVRLLNARLGGVEADPALLSRALRPVRRHPRLHSEQSVPALPAWALDRVRELSEARAGLVGDLAAQGVRVVGDPDRLRVPAEAEPAPDGVPALLHAELAAEAIAALIEAVTQRERELEARHQRVVRRLRTRAAASPDRADGGATASIPRRVRARARRWLRPGA